MGLENKKVLLSVTGSISAYKACDLVQRFKDEGAIVKVIMTQSAAKLVHPNTFAILTGSSVSVDIFSSCENGKMDHIDLARWADIFVIAPCTAHTLGEIANGLTGSIVSLAYLVYDKPVFIAPAMNSVMLAADSVQRNIALLKNKGDAILPTGEGILACSEVGYGKLLDVMQIVHFIKSALTLSPLKSLNSFTTLKSFEKKFKTLAGKKVLISLGHTEEKWDDVRFISNRSSGKTGLALARIFYLAGAKVHLVAGVMEDSIPPGFMVTRVKTSSEFLECMLDHQSESDIILMAAAIADFVPASVIVGKRRDSKSLAQIELKPFPNILMELGKRKKAPQILVGFALETEDAINHAKKKMVERNCDLIVVNNPVDSISNQSGEMESETNQSLGIGIGLGLNVASGFGKNRVNAALLLNPSHDTPRYEKRVAANSVTEPSLTEWDKDELAAEIIYSIDKLIENGLAEFKK